MATEKYVKPEKFLNKIPSERTTMKCSYGLLMFLDRKAGRHETYEDVIWRIVAHQKLTGEDKKDMKEAGYEKYI